MKTAMPPGGFLPEYWSSHLENQYRQTVNTVSTTSKPLMAASYRLKELTQMLSAIRDCRELSDLAPLIERFNSTYFIFQNDLSDALIQDLYNDLGSSG